MSSPTSPGKEIRETDDENTPINGMRERRRDPNQVSRKDYSHANGGCLMSELDHHETHSPRSSSAATRHHRRKEIRRRLKHKHDHAAPKVLWTKFMHSDTKNRTSLTLRYVSSANEQQIWLQYWESSLARRCSSSSLSPGRKWPILELEILQTAAPQPRGSSKSLLQR